MRGTKQKRKRPRPSTETIITQPGFAVRSSAGRGRGLYTDVARAAGEELFVVEGPVHTYDYDDEADYGPTWFGAGPNRWVEPSESNLGRFINHACEPNARVVDYLHVVAARPIAAGEELTIDYAETEEDPGWSMACRCGSPHCRRTIRGGVSFAGPPPRSSPPRKA